MVLRDLQQLTRDIGGRVVFALADMVGDAPCENADRRLHIAELLSQLQRARVSALRYSARPRLQSEQCSSVACLQRHFLTMATRPFRQIRNESECLSQLSDRLN